MGHQEWLERPYQDMMDESDRYYDWCEENDLDPDSPEAELAYEDAWASEWDYDDHAEDDDLLDEWIEEWYDE